MIYSLWELDPAGWTTADNQPDWTVVSCPAEVLPHAADAMAAERGPAVRAGRRGHDPRSIYRVSLNAAQKVAVCIGREQKTRFFST